MDRIFYQYKWGGNYYRLNEKEQLNVYFEYQKSHRIIHDFLDELNGIKHSSQIETYINYDIFNEIMYCYGSGGRFRIVRYPKLNEIMRCVKDDVFVKYLNMKGDHTETWIYECNYRLIKSFGLDVSTYKQKFTLLQNLLKYSDESLLLKTSEQIRKEKRQIKRDKRNAIISKYRERELSPEYEQELIQSML